MDEFFEAWWWLNSHPAFGHPKYRGDVNTNRFSSCLDVEVVKVNPKTERIENNEDLNTDVRVWLECGPTEMIDGRLETTHDWNLDCGGETFEEAIVELAKLVKQTYGETYKGDND